MTLLLSGGWSQSDDGIARLSLSGGVEQGTVSGTSDLAASYAIASAGSVDLACSYAIHGKVRPAFVNGANSGSDSSGQLTRTVTLDCYAGNTIFVGTSNYTASGVAITGVTDTAGNTYSKCGSSGGGDGNHTTEVWAAHSATNHTSNVITVTFASNADYRVAVAVQYDGIVASGFYDAGSTGLLSADAATKVTNALTTTEANDLVLGWWVSWNGLGGAVNTTSGSSTSRVFVALSGFSERVAGSAGSYTTEITTSSTGTHYSFARAFKAITIGASTSSGTSDLACSYSIASAGTSDLACSYPIASAGTADLAASYAVASAGTADLAASYYAIASAGNADLVCSYDIDAAIMLGSSSLACSYAIASAGTSDLAASYAIALAGQADLLASYAILVGGNADLPCSYQIAASGTVDLSCSYAVAAAGQSDLLASYAILATGSADLACSFAIRNAGYVDLACAFGIDGASGGGASPAAIWAHILPNGKTAGQTLVENNEMMRIILAGIAGTSQGVGTDTETYFGDDGTTPRIVAVFDSAGNRVSVVTNGAA